MTNSERFIDVDKWSGEEEELDEVGGLPATRHRYDRDSLHAINAALAASRPLLVRGEPGTGKSQLARAAAQRLGRRFVWRVMNARAKVADLFFDFDAVERLAQAQVAGVFCGGEEQRFASVEAFLDERNFVRPGPLWWAFDSAGARAWGRRAEAREWVEEVDEVEGELDDRPYVVLIDEIDKTDPSVPNGLLEALGQGTFPVKKGETVSLQGEGREPLIIITTNDERELPGAFLRRCLVYPILLPRENLAGWLMKRGRAHFPGMAERLLERAATLVCADRGEAEDRGLLPPGQAEYLDLLRAISELREGEEERAELLETIARFALEKHPDLYEKRRSKIVDDG